MVEEVCATNGVTYKNLCELNKVKCKDNTVRVAYEGECTGTKFYKFKSKLKFNVKKKKKTHFPT